MYEAWQLIRLIEGLNAAKMNYTLFLKQEAGVFLLRKNFAIRKLLSAQDVNDIFDMWLFYSALGFMDENGTVVMVLSDTLPPDMLQNQVDNAYGTLFKSNCDRSILK